MGDKVYTLLDLAEEFGKDKQFIRRRINRLKLRAINKDSREHINEPLKYSWSTYLELAEEFGVQVIKNDVKSEIRGDRQSNTHETRDDTHETRDDTHEKPKNMDKDQVIKVLERELRHSKDKLEKSEEEKETLMRLLDQQQRLSLQANQKIEMLEASEQEINEDEIKDNEKKKWWQFFK